MCVYDFIEFKNFGYNLFTLSFVVVFLSLFFEAKGFLLQANKIKSMNSVKSVSLKMYVYLFFLFLSFLVYGLEIKSLLLIFNGLLLLSCIIVICEIVKIKRLNSTDKYFLLLCFVVMVMMICFSFKDIFFLIFATGGVLVLFLQIYELYKEKTTGAVEIKLLIIYFITTLFFIYYAYVIKDRVVIYLGISTLIVLFLILCFWFYYYHNERKCC